MTCLYKMLYDNLSHCQISNQTSSCRNCKQNMPPEQRMLCSDICIHRKSGNGNWWETHSVLNRLIWKLYSCFIVCCISISVPFNNTSNNKICISCLYDGINYKFCMPFLETISSQQTNIQCRNQSSLANCIPPVWLQSSTCDKLFNRKSLRKYADIPKPENDQDRMVQATPGHIINSEYRAPERYAISDNIRNIQTKLWEAHNVKYKVNIHTRLRHLHRPTLHRVNKFTE